MYYNTWTPTIWKSFLFNLQSNGRLSQPMKFEIKQIHDTGYWLSKNDDDDLISLACGGIRLFKEHKKSESCCNQHETGFNYHGITSALCGKYNFTPKRILVIQMN